MKEHHLEKLPKNYFTMNRGSTVKVVNPTARPHIKTTPFDDPADYSLPPLDLENAAANLDFGMFSTPDPFSSTEPNSLTTMYAPPTEDGDIILPYPVRVPGAVFHNEFCTNLFRRFSQIPGGTIIWAYMKPFNPWTDRVSTQTPPKPGPSCSRQT